MSQETTPRLFTLQTHEEYGFHAGVRADGTRVLAGGFHGHMVAGVAEPRQDTPTTRAPVTIRLRSRSSP
ncbi:hypothetical protein [Archangium lansingense]|uniref:Uncharacterized protein n=1 Tax=Archangium lansingense TaxID=2995310 RepID=A0ABT4A2I1_9BACT|nr:hypothetical protein [Archangium lansinium]MCY1075853.1 hypothetical protein [Archangium lansinium]